MDGTSWAPEQVDITMPNEARVYDFLLGGSHNFASDRAFARAVIAASPEVPAILREHRGFLFRVVRFLVAAQVDQFLDLGSGILTAGNVHETAQAVNPAARVVHVDVDPVAVAHSRTLLDGRPRTYAMAADLLDPEQVLAEAVDRGGLDLGRPVAVVASGVLHFVPDDDRPAEVMARYLRALVPGSHLAISHLTASGDGVTVPGLAYCARERSILPMWPRSGVEVAALFGDLTPVDPGLVPIPAWRPGLGEVRVAPDRHPMLGGIARRA